MPHLSALYFSDGNSFDAVARRVQGGEYGLRLTIGVLERVRLREGEEAGQLPYMIGVLTKAVKERQCVFFLSFEACFRCELTCPLLQTADERSESC